MMNVEVYSPMSTPWMSKCGPPKYGYEGFVDHPARPYVGNSSRLVENISWVQFAEREPMIPPKPRQETAVPRSITPASKPSSIQIAGKSLLGRGDNASLSETSSEQGESIQWYCDTYEDSSLIPGLPDDVAQMCLALVHREDFPSVRKVCKAWWDLISTREFYRTRKGVGTLEEWLYVLTVAKDTKSTQWEVLNPKQKGDWRVLPRMPGPGKVGSGSIVVNEKLLVIGGLVMDDKEAYVSPDVYIYDPVLDNWTKVASMKAARYEFACGVLDGKVYVVGGHGHDGEALASMEVYDLEEDEWKTSIPLKKPRWGCFSAGVEGKLYVFGGRSSFTLGSARFMDVFDPKTGSWSEVKNGCAMVLTHAVNNGKIYTIEWKDERSLRCYDTAKNMWTKVTLPIPCKSRAGFCLGTYGSKLQFFPTEAKPCYETIVYDPEAPKGSEWQTTTIKARGAVMSCATMTA
ncbi:unnamed protein product [Calypogeia fissa]